MINLNEQVEIIVTGYAPQARRKADKYYYANFDVAIGSLKQMYRNGYNGTGYLGCMNLFETVVC